MTEDEKHRLYAAALAASDKPLDTQSFKRVCQVIGIFDQHGQPNDKYLAFVAKHVDWSTNSQAAEFRRQVNTRDTAKAYVDQRLLQMNLKAK